jgi:hypothetical protein
MEKDGCFHNPIQTSCLYEQIDESCITNNWLIIASKEGLQKWDLVLNSSLNSSHGVGVELNTPASIIMPNRVAQIEFSPNMRILGVRTTTDKLFLLDTDSL